MRDRPHNKCKHLVHFDAFLTHVPNLDRRIPSAIFQTIIGQNSQRHNLIRVSAERVEHNPTCRVPYFDCLIP